MPTSGEWASPTGHLGTFTILWSFLSSLSFGLHYPDTWTPGGLTPLLLHGVFPGISGGVPEGRLERRHKDPGRGALPADKEAATSCFLGVNRNISEMQNFPLNRYSPQLDLGPLRITHSDCSSTGNNTAFCFYFLFLYSSFAFTLPLFFSS